MGHHHRDLAGWDGSPAISVSPTSWDFGSTPVGSPLTKEFTISNSGNGALEITLPITSDNAAFTITTPPPVTSLAPGASTTFTAQFNGSLVQAYSGNLSIVSNAASSPTVIAVTGTMTIITSGLVAWYDASYAAGLWEDSARTIAAADNADVIGAWDDKSGNGYHVIQATTGNKPTLRTSVQNSKPVIRFDGSDDFLANASFPDFGDAYTIFAVMAYAAGGVVFTDTAFEVGVNTTNNSGFLLFNRIWRGKDASTLRDVAGGATLDSIFRVHRGINSGSQMQYWMNNASQGTVAYTAPNPSALNRITIGRSLGGSNPLIGDFAELLIYSRNLTTTEQTNVESYLNTKWAVY